MVRIRFRRVGAAKQPSYRLVAVDKESPRDGRFLEILGFYNPRTEPATLQLHEDRIYEWMKNGAQPSDSARQLFQSAGVLGRFERFKAGEAVETLLQEASAVSATQLSNVQSPRAVSPKKESKKGK